MGFVGVRIMPPLELEARGIIANDTVDALSQATLCSTYHAGEERNTYRMLRCIGVSETIVEGQLLRIVRLCSPGVRIHVALAKLLSPDPSHLRQPVAWSRALDGYVVCVVEVVMDAERPNTPLSQCTRALRMPFWVSLLNAIIILVPPSHHVWLGLYTLT